MAAALRLVLGDQLTRGLVSFADLDPANDVVLMAELIEEATYVRHHKRKVAFLFSAMRHFAEELRAEGIAVDYIRLDDTGKAAVSQAMWRAPSPAMALTGLLSLSPVSTGCWRRCRAGRPSLGSWPRSAPMTGS